MTARREAVEEKEEEEKEEEEKVQAYQASMLELVVAVKFQAVLLWRHDMLTKLDFQMDRKLYSISDEHGGWTMRWLE